MTLQATEAAPEGTLPPPFSSLLEACRRLNGVARRTPLLESRRLNREAGRRILVKAECLQHCGTFKFRGAWNHLRAHAREAAERGVLSVSSGNHAQGVARAAMLLDCRATIVMPDDAPAPKLEGTRAYGAEIATYRRSDETSERVASRLLRESGALFVRPYDDPFVIAGQGTVGLEIAADALRLGVSTADVLVPCSGGGLAAGCALALAEEAPGLRVRTVEPAGLDDWARSLEAGERRSNARGATSICDGLLCETPGSLTWKVGRDRFGAGLAVGESAILHAVATAFRTLRLAVEPSGAAGLAAAIGGGAGISDPAIVVVTGGNVAPGLLTRCIGGDSPEAERPSSQNWKPD